MRCVGRSDSEREIAHLVNGVWGASLERVCRSERHATGTLFTARVHCSLFTVPLCLEKLDSNRIDSHVHVSRSVREARRVCPLARRALRGVQTRLLHSNRASRAALHSARAVLQVRLLI